MIVFDKKSWHYKLINYTFSEKFFLDTSQIDWRATESQEINTKKFKIIYKSKPKTVNLCPYCRAVVGSLLTLPFLYIWRLFPHKPKEPETRASMNKRANRNSWLARIIGAAINIGMGSKHIIFDEDPMALLGIGQIIVGVFLLTGHWWMPQMIRWIIEHTPKRKREYRVEKIKEPRKPSELAKKIHKKHDIICPPIFFVDVKSDEELQ